MGKAVLRIACATVYDPRAHHGIAEKMSYRIRAIGHACGPLELLGPLRMGAYRPLTLSKLLFYRTIQGTRYYPYRDKAVVESFGRQLSQKLARSSSNLVLSMEWNGSQPVAYLECRQPIVIWTDATFAGVLDSHPNFARECLCVESLRDALANEHAALQRCRLAIFLSDWAAQKALQLHALDPARVRVVPGGANLEAGLGSAEVAAVVAARPSDRCRLLFIANRWRDKGGDLAVEVATALNKAGLPTTLTLVGARPSSPAPPPQFVRWVGQLSKSLPEDWAMLERLLREAHFLILPTRADAFGFVFCEASAFAVPSLATDVCGVPSAVAEGRNGRLFPLDAGAEAYSAYIEDLFHRYADYSDLARSSFDEYATRLNWATAAAEVRRCVLDAL